MEKESTNFSNFYFSKIDFEDRYIEFISYFFNKFINEFGSKYEDIDLGLPEFMKKEEFDLNNQLISNIETFELVNKNDNYRQIFKIFLMFFRKIKRSEKEFLLPSVINYQNKLVSQIADLLKEGNEDSFPSFSQFIDVFGNEKDYIINNEENINLLQIENDINIRDFDAMKIISFWQNVLDNTNDKKYYIKNDDKKLKDVNLFIRNFQPFHNGHLEVCKKIKEYNQKNIIIIQVNFDELTINKPISIKNSKLMLKEITENFDFVEDFYVVSSYKLYDIINLIKDKYFPVTILSNTKYQNFLIKQKEFNDIFNRYECFNFEFLNIIELMSDKNVKYNSYELRKDIESDNFLKFQKGVPKCLFNLFLSFKEDFKNL